MRSLHHRDATYRLQLSADFTLDHAAAAVPYLARLGISHLYLSPIWMAVPGSQHGYDVIDHARVSEDLGGLSGLYRLGEVLRAHEMDLVVDIVPNHVGITDHPWWRDVLRFGPASTFAAFFDIDWSWPGQPAKPVVVCPVLGQPFGAALESGELSLDFDGNEIVVRYWERTFPVAPASYARVLGLPPANLDDGLSVELAGAIDVLASATPSEAATVVARLANLSRQAPAVEAWIRLRLAAWSGEPGVPASWDNLEALLAEQHYRLAYWRVSSEEINYRRFFDINELAAIRQEHRPAFEATHRLLGELIASGLVSGIRVDHIDGLYDPGGYLNDLRALASAAGSADIWVEKILATNESLPAYWPVQGTTGYDFLAIAGGGPGRSLVRTQPLGNLRGLCGRADALRRRCFRGEATDSRALLRRRAERSRAGASPPR